MQIQIITPEKKVFEGDIDELIAPTVQGDLAILPHHVDLLTQIAPGEMTLKTKGKDQHLAISGGFLHVVSGTISVLSDHAVRSEDIDAKKALEAQKRAEEVLRQKGNAISDQDIANAQASLRRSIAELKVANRRRHHTL